MSTARQVHKTVSITSHASGERKARSVRGWAVNVDPVVMATLADEAVAVSVRCIRVKA
jgi:hypothetical protein